MVLLNIPTQNINYVMLNYITLSDRRMVSDHVLRNKMINNDIKGPENLDKIKLHLPTRNTRQFATFLCDNLKTNYHTNAPINRLLNPCYS